jgi:excisionase family DNA binding protein
VRVPWFETARNGGAMAAYTLKQAAVAIGKSKPTVLRAIQSGKISALRDETTGGWLIEPAELHRLYPPVVPVMVHDVTMNSDVIPHETVQLRRELEMLREERERERQEAQTTISDLRVRLDRSEEERRQTQTRLSALLEDKTAAPAPAAITAPAKRGWWSWRR